jgi:hypothetical protein
MVGPQPLVGRLHLRRKFKLSGIAGPLEARSKLNGRVVLDDHVSKDFTIDGGVLLDDGQEGQDDNHSPTLVFAGMLESERHHGKRLAAACRCGQAEESWLAFGLVDTCLKELFANPVHIRISGFAVQHTDMLFEFLEQLLGLKVERRPTTAEHILLGIEIVGVDEAREEHANHQLVARVRFEASPSSWDELRTQLR